MFSGLVGNILVVPPYDVFLALYGLVDNEDAMSASDWAQHASFGESYHGSDYVVEVVDDEN